jgi:hypothetical protein
MGDSSQLLPILKPPELPELLFDGFVMASACNCLGLALARSPLVSACWPVPPLFAIGNFIVGVPPALPPARVGPRSLRT